MAHADVSHGGRGCQDRLHERRGADFPVASACDWSTGVTRSRPSVDGITFAEAPHFLG